MALPKQVQQDLDDIAEMEKQMGAQPQSTETPEVATQSSPEPSETPSQSDPAPVVAEVKKPDEWEHKYRTLEGKYTAEVPRLHSQNKELAAQLQALQQQVEALKQPHPAEKPTVTDPLVTDKDVQEYGQELIDVQRRVAREVMRDTVAPLQAELEARDAKIAELEQKLNRNSGDVATMSFEQKLLQEVPDFQAINSDSKWIEWLDSEDPYTGEPRRVFADFAYNNGDIAKVKRVVEQFKSTTQAPVVDERSKRQAELERQVTPTRANAQRVETQTSGTAIYTEAQMVSLFNKVRELNRDGKRDEATKLEDELSNAYIEGRVRG